MQLGDRYGQLRAAMAEHLADFYQGCGLSRQGLAILAGLTLQELAALESLSPDLTADVLERFSKFLDSTLSDLVAREKRRFQ